MTLLEIRKLFITLSGRYDLVKDTEKYEDDGVDFFLNSGQRMLDSMITHSKSYGQSELPIQSGKAVYNAPYVLSIEGIQVTSDTGRVTLSHIREQEIEEQDPTDETSTGSPLYYAIYTGIQSPLTGNSKEQLSRLSFKLFPTPDADLMAYVYGRISIPLEKDDDYNFWTLSYPETLMAAAMYQIERFHRNTQGMRDHMRAIQIDLRELDANAIESQLGSLTQMKDSFEFRGEGNVR